MQLKVFELIVDALMVMHPISFSNLYDASMSHPPIRKFKFRKSPTNDWQQKKKKNILASYLFLRFIYVFINFIFLNLDNHIKIKIFYWNLIFILSIGFYSQYSLLSRRKFLVLGWYENFSILSLFIVYYKSNFYELCEVYKIIR